MPTVISSAARSSMRTGPCRRQPRSAAVRFTTPHELVAQGRLEAGKALVVLGCEIEAVDVGHEDPVHADLLIVARIALRGLRELDRLQARAEGAREESLDRSLEAFLEVPQDAHERVISLPVSPMRLAESLGGQTLRADCPFVPPWLHSAAPLGRVAEWQTRRLQVPVSFGTWGFKSPSPTEHRALTALRAG